MNYVIFDSNGNAAEAETTSAAGVAVQMLLEDDPDLASVVVTRRQETQDLEKDLVAITDGIAKQYGLAAPEPIEG